MNATDSEKIFKVLAESPRGPQIISLDNIVATQFHITHKYPQTTLFLRNYVVQMITRLQTESDKLDIPLSAVTYCVLPARPMLTCSTNQPRFDTSIQSPGSTYRQTTATTFRAHSVNTNRQMTGLTSRPMTGISNRPTTSSSIRLHISVRNTETVKTVTSPETLRTYIEPAAQRPISPERPKSAGMRYSGFTFSKRHTEPVTVENNATTDIPIQLKTTAAERDLLKPYTGRISPFQSPTTERTYKGPIYLETRGSFDKDVSVFKLKEASSIGNRVSIATKQ